MTTRQSATRSRREPLMYTLLILFLLIGFTIEHSIADYRRCYVSSECVSGSFCAHFSDDGSRRQLYSSCSNSVDCPVHSSCISISESGVLDECFSQNPTTYNESCICAPQREGDIHNYYEMDTVELSLSTTGKKHCISCPYLTNHNFTLGGNVCSSIFKFQRIPRGENGSVLKSCVHTSD